VLSQNPKKTFPIVKIRNKKKTILKLLLNFAQSTLHYILNIYIEYLWVKYVLDP